MINKIDDVLNGLDEEDENEAELSGIDNQVELYDLDTTGLNMVAQMRRHSSKDERVIS